MTENKRFTIKEIDNFNYGIKVTDVIMDDGIELPQSTVCDLLNDLSDENEHIKNTIKEAYETERTHIGKSVLKQLLNNIEAIQ